MNTCKISPDKIQKNNGFTVIELIIAVAIIVVLAAILVFNVGQSIQKAKIAAAKAELNQIAKAISLYESQMGHSPACATGGGGVFADFEDQTAWNNTVADLVAAGVISNSKNIKDDPWGNPYNYIQSIPTMPSCSAIASEGPNGSNDSGWNSCANSTIGGDDIGVIFDQH